jgi:hypothetical protein
MRKKELIAKFFVKAFSKKRRFPSGCSCTYIQMSKSIGIKCWNTESWDDDKNRDHSFKRQKKAHKHGIAPKPYFKFDFFNNFVDEKWMCYVTQHAGKTRGNIYSKYKTKLSLKLEEIGFDTGDVKPSNCGVIKGKLVCIDFDDGSMS